MATLIFRLLRPRLRHGDEAIDLIESPTRIDVILTDIVLPGGMDGVTLVKEAMRVAEVKSK